MICSLFYWKELVSVAFSLSQKIMLQTAEFYKQLCKLVREICLTNAYQVMKQDKYYFLGFLMFCRHCRNVWPSPNSVVQFQTAEGLLGTSFREQWEKKIYLAGGMMRVQLSGGSGGKDRDWLLLGCWVMAWWWLVLELGQKPEPCCFSAEFQFSPSSNSLLHSWGIFTLDMWGKSELPCFVLILKPTGLIQSHLSEIS